MFRESALVARSRHRARRLTVAAVGATLATAIVALVMFLGSGAASGPIASGPPSGPFEPTAEHGLIRGDEHVSLADEQVPAIARLNPVLRDALREAEADAAVDGLAFQVTSGWRSTEYQEWLFDDAVEFYGGEDVARRFVATPEKSKHVSGEAVDIVPVDAQYWLIEHGSRYGLCQTYANETWHFERATEPGGVCPEMKADATS